MKDKAIFLDMGDEIAADALFVDWVEPVVPRNLVSSSGRWSQDLVEKADQILKTANPERRAPLSR